MNSATRIAVLERELAECVQSHQRQNGEMAAIECAIEQVTRGDWDDIVPAIERIGKELAAQRTLCREWELKYLQMASIAENRRKLCDELVAKIHREGAELA